MARTSVSLTTRIEYTSGGSFHPPIAASGNGWFTGRTHSPNIQDAMRLRDQILGKKARGELGDSTTDRITCNELLDDLLEYARANIKPSTAQISELVISANIRPFSGHLKAGALTTEKFKEYRRKLWVIKTRCVNRINGLSPGLLLLTNAARLTSERWVRSSSP